MTEPTKEQVRKEEARKAYQDQQSQDNEGGCREPTGFVQGYLAAKKSDFEEIKTLKEQLNKCESALKNYAICDDIGTAARRYFQDKQGE